MRQTKYPLLLTKPYRAKIRVALRKRKLRQQDLAEELGVSNAYVSRILGGDSSTPVEVAVRIFEYLGRDKELEFLVKPEMIEFSIGEVDPKLWQGLFKEYYNRVEQVYSNSRESEKGRILEDLENLVRKYEKRVLK